MGRHPAMNSFLFSSRDRVGWYTAAGEYVEFSLDGDEIGRYQGPAGLDRPDGVAISEDNDVVLGDFRATRESPAPPDAGAPQFLVLDRSSGEWIPVSLPEGQAPRWAHVLGFDGTTLVATSINGKLTRYRAK